MNLEEGMKMRKKIPVGGDGSTLGTLL